MHNNIYLLKLAVLHLMEEALAVVYRYPLAQYPTLIRTLQAELLQEQSGSIILRLLRVSR